MSVQYLESQIISLVYIDHTSVSMSPTAHSSLYSQLWFLYSPTGVWTLYFSRKYRSFSCYDCLISHNPLVLWTDSMSSVPSIPVMSIFHSASNCFDVPHRYQALVSKWVLSHWVLQKETTWVARRFSLWSQDHPLGGVFLRSLAAWIRVSVSFSITKTGTKHCVLTEMLPGDSCICDLSWCVLFSDLDYDLCFCFDLFFYFFFQQSTIPIQQVSNQTFALMLWM